MPGALEATGGMNPYQLAFMDEQERREGTSSPTGPIGGTPPMLGASGIGAPPNVDPKQAYWGGFMQDLAANLNQDYRPFTSGAAARSQAEIGNYERQSAYNKEMYERNRQQQASQLAAEEKATGLERVDQQYYDLYAKHKGNMGGITRKSWRGMSKADRSKIVGTESGLGTKDDPTDDVKNMRVMNRNRAITRDPKATHEQKADAQYAIDVLAKDLETPGFMRYDIATRKMVSTDPKISRDSLSPGDKKVDEVFATDYAAWVTGGYADVEKSVIALEEVAGELGKRDDLTGPFIGLMPDTMQAMVAPDATHQREKVAEITQRNLKLILGSQFTEKEGENLIKRTYNPVLSESKNAERVKKLYTAMAAAAKSKQEAVDYYQKKGTLSGFKGKRYNMADFDAILNADDKLNQTGGGAKTEGGWSIKRT